MTERLKSFERDLAQRNVGLRSLRPVADGAVAPGLVERVEAILAAARAVEPRAEDFAEVLPDVVERVLLSLLDGFPDNLFWDVDAMLARFLVESAAARTRDLRLVELGARVARLERLDVLFGRHGRIRFLYIHDLIYGFDWARWVAKDPASRSGTGPFDLSFLDRMLRRGQELLVLIGTEDAKYPPLAEGETARNPFSWSREPHDEERLLRELAAEGLLPVAAWDPRARPEWGTDFERAREDVALRLGLVDGRGRGEGGSGAG